ncbi:MAG: serine/threonine protein kinase [Caldilineaceae bacterium]|nr:serine/threonine protein kinase [Caldilineaceae bacterium]
MAKIKAGSRIGPYPYRLIKPLGYGYGNMSDVYLATTSATEPVVPADLVVIKISKAQNEHQDFFKDTIYNESERLRQLRHPGIVRILPIQTDNPMRQLPYAARANLLPGNPWFLVLEYLAGGSLTDLIQQHGNLQPTLAIQIARSLAETLDYIHRNDQVHLDIKPENILFRHPLESSGRIEPVLIDFGIARNTGQEGLEARTLFYAPPERVQINRSNVAPERMPRPQPSMDVYSLGVVLYQMLTGRRPFDGRTDKGISSAILAGNPTKPSLYSGDVSQPVEGLILQTMDRQPLNRPTAGELVQKLETIIAKTGASPQPQLSGTLQIGASRTWKLRKRLQPFLNGLALLGLFVIALETVSYAQTGRLWPASQPELRQTIQKLIQPLRDAGAKTEPPTAPPSATPTNTVVAIAPSAISLAVNITPTLPSTTTPTPLPPPATATVLPSPTATLTARAPTSTPVKEATLVATATSVSSIQTPPRTGLTMSTPVPDHTAIPAATPTPAPTNTQTPPPAASSPTPRPPTPTPRIPRTVQLITPDDGASGQGKVEFRWQANFTLEAGQAFEPIFWRQGQEPLVSGLGWGGTSQATSHVIDFDAATPDVYLWGVLLVKTNPYERVEFLGGGWRYTVQGSSHSTSR